MDLVYFLLGGTSLQLPSATSAAMPMLSPSLGCGWMVLPMSTASAPISMASAISLINGYLVKRWTNEERLLPGQVVEQALIAALGSEEGDEVDEERAEGCYLGAH